MNIYLTGYRGTGKTVIGQILADKLYWKWIDSDHMIQLDSKKTIAEIFQQEGESVFRDHESKAISQIAKLTNHVVSLGGGAILSEENRRHIQESGKVVWLKATAETITQRLKQDRASHSQRPRLTAQSSDNEIKEVLQQRTPVYAALADFEIDTEAESPSELSDKISEWIRSLK